MNRKGDIELSKLIVIILLIVFILFMLGWYIFDLGPWLNELLDRIGGWL